MNPSEMQEYDLVRGILRGEVPCEEALYRRFSVPMFRVCLRYACDQQEAEDMLQEGFLKIFNELKDFRFEGSLEGWMRRIMVRTALRVMRKRRSFGFAEPPEAGADWPQYDDAGRNDGDDFVRLVDLLKKLPDGYRTVLNLFALEGYSHDEIAGLMGISAGTSRSQLSKARAMLRKMFLQHTSKVL